VKLQHVALEARHEHVLAEIRFWGLLGFTEALPPAALAKRSVWLSCGPVQVHLLLAQDPLPSPEGHAAFVADDYSATVDRLRGAGVEVLRSLPGRSPGGADGRAAGLRPTAPTGSVV